MSIQNEINSRTAKLQTILADANDAIAAKNGAAAADLNGLPAAIDGIPAGDARLQVKAVTPTGKLITVRPDAGFGGLSAVNVAGDAYLVPENIADGVTIYGVTGTHEGSSLEWEDIIITPTGEEMKVGASEGKGIRYVTVKGDEELVGENILVSANIYGVEGEAYSGLQAPEECIERLWDAIYALSGNYDDYINAALKPGGPDFFVAESDEYITVGVVRPEGISVTEYNADTTEFYSYGWLNYSIKKSTGEVEMDNYWSSESPGGNFAKNIRYSTVYIEYGEVILFPVGQGEEGGVDAAKRRAVNLFPYLSFEEQKYTEAVLEYDSVFNGDFARGTVKRATNASQAHSGEYYSAMGVHNPVSDNYYKAYGFYDVCKAAYGHRFYCQGWVKQDILITEYPGELVLCYGSGKAETNVIVRTIMPITTEGEWELVSGCIYVDPAKINNAGAKDEIWLRVGVGVGMESTNLHTYADDILVVDLTETFGAGSEPTAEECKNIFADYDGVSRFICSAAERPQYYLGTSTEITSGKTLAAHIACQPGDLVVAAIATRDTLTVSDGWTLLSTSNVNSGDTNNQRLSWAYKFAENAAETIEVTQASAQRLYINMVAISNASGVVDKGYFYKNTPGNSITVNKPAGLTLWAVTCPIYNTNLTVYPVWTASPDMPLIQLGENAPSRLMTGLDQSDKTSVTFAVPTDDNGYTLEATMIAGALTVLGIDRFY